MLKFKTPLIALLLCFSAYSGCTSSGPGASTSGGKGEAAAVVNGSKISISEVDRVTNEQAQGQQGQLSQLEVAAARLKSLESLITDEVLFQRATKENLLPSEQDVNTFIQQSKAEGGLTEEAFQKRLKETNQTEAEFKDNIRKQLAVRKLQENISNQIKVSDREVEEFFKVNPPVAAAGIALSDIIVDPGINFQGNDPNDAKGDTAAKAKVDEIYAQLKRGADFATIARTRSEDQSALRAGDLGFIGMEQVQQSFGPFTARITALKEGDISEPLKESNGRWHIFKMTGKRTETKKLTLDDPDVRTQITNEIRTQRASLLYSAMVAQARNEAKVENYLIADLVKNPNSLGVLRPVNPQASASPAASSSAAAATPATFPSKAATGSVPAATPKK